MELNIDSNAVVDRKPTRSRQAYARSRVSNGRDVLPDVDGRSTIARRYRDIMAAILVDQGGADQCSESRKQLIRRFAAASVLAEMLESKLANGEQIDLQEHATLSSTLVRLAVRIGVDRVPREVGSTIGDLMRLAAEIPPEPGESDNGDDDAAQMVADAPDAVEATTLPPAAENESGLNVESQRAIPDAVDNADSGDSGDGTDDWIDEE